MNISGVIKKRYLNILRSDTRDIVKKGIKKERPRRIWLAFSFAGFAFKEIARPNKASIYKTGKK